MIGGSRQLAAARWTCGKYRDCPLQIGSWHDLGKLGEAMLGPVGLWAGWPGLGLPGHSCVEGSAVPQPASIFKDVGERPSATSISVSRTATSCSVFKILASPSCSSLMNSWEAACDCQSYAASPAEAVPLPPPPVPPDSQWDHSILKEPGLLRQSLLFDRLLY